MLNDADLKGLINDMILIKILLNPQLWGILLIAVGLKMTAFGMKMKNGRYITAQIYGYLEKTMKSGEITYTPLVTVYMDGEEKIMPIAAESDEMKYETGQMIDVVYIKNKETVFLPGFPHIRVGLGLSVSGTVLMIGFALLSIFLEK